MKKITEKGDKILDRKIEFLLLGITIAILGSVPYVIFRDNLQKLPITGYIGLLISCVVANSTVFFPASSILYVLAAGTVLNQWLCCLIGGVGSAIGEQVGYFCGCVGSRMVENTVVYHKVSRWLDAHGFLTVFIFAALPVPVFDAVGVAAGSCRMKWHIFTIASVLGKIVKMFLTVFIMYHLFPAVLELMPEKFTNLK